MALSGDRRARPRLIYSSPIPWKFHPPATGTRPTCTTAIIDARTGEIIVEFPGEALGASGDGTTAILLRHGTYLIEGVSLEGMLGLLTGPGSFY